MGLQDSILQAALEHGDFDSSPDLVVTEDFNGVNSGDFDPSQVFVFQT